MSVASGDGRPVASDGDADPAAAGIGSFVRDHMAEGRRAAGMDGTVDRRPLFRALREEGLSAYPLFALLVLGVVNQLAGSATGLVAPDISRTFGLTPQFFTVLSLLGQVSSFVVPLVVARLVQNRPMRAAVILATQGIWVLLAGFQGLVLTVAALMVLSLLDDMASSAHGTVASPLMIDLYPPSVRVRVVAVLAATGMATSLVSTGTTYLLTGPMNLSWRGVYVAGAILTLIGLLFAIRLRDPGYGAHDAQAVRAAIAGRLDEEGRTSVRTSPDVAASRPVDGPADEDGTSPGAVRPGARAGRGGAAGRRGSWVRPRRERTLSERTRLSVPEAIARIYSIRSMRIMLIAGMVGAIPAPVGIYLAFHLAQRFSLSLDDRALLALVGAVVGLVSYLILAPIGDRIFQRSPQRLFYITGGLALFGSVAGIGQMFVYSLWALVALTVVTSAFSGLSGPALTVGTMSIVPAPLRPHVGAVSAMFSLIGAAAGTALLGGLTKSIGIPMAVAITLAFSIAGTIMTMVAGRHVRADLDATIQEVVEDTYVSHLQEEGDTTPLLSVRDLDFSYGPSQVLFGAELSVRSGECVALLGVNGAGKSTLLRAISGLGLPSSGSIRLQGADITYLDADRRARLGIVQVPGGKAVFTDLTVAENLRACAISLSAGERRELPERIEDVYRMFPSLSARRSLSASALSGGERQMLGIARALIRRPSLLIIDELSLGLAPKVVGELLDVVRTINASGVSVILVEQSVNIALTVADRVYFMERGRVQFEGTGEELLETGLLRAVFLGDKEERR